MYFRDESIMVTESGSVHHPGVVDRKLEPGGLNGELIIKDWGSILC